MAQLESLIPEIIKVFPHNVKLPILGETNSDLIDRESVSYILEDAQGIWGTDSIGGIAYFGKNQDIFEVLQQARNYLLNSKTYHLEKQFLLLWTVDEYSLLNIYENYFDEPDNPIPSHQSVLQVYFGTFCDDDLLLQVLNDQKYLDEHWFYNQSPVDLNNPEQLLLLKDFKKCIVLIDESQAIEN
jgi:hypothetical protein